MTPLERRVEKLEASHPKENSLANLTQAELDESIFLGIKQMHDEGIKLVSEFSLMNIKCRQLYKDEPWVRYVNHRICVFNDFLGIAYEQNLPEKIKAVFGLGLKNIPIPEKDIELTLKTLHDANLGEETPWPKGYLECSGVVDEYLEHGWRRKIFR